MNQSQSDKQLNNIFVGLVATGIGTILAFLFAFGTEPIQLPTATFCAGAATLGFITAFWNFIDYWVNTP